jgi:hypothetical protein
MTVLDFLKTFPKTKKNFLKDIYQNLEKNTLNFLLENTDDPEEQRFNMVHTTARTPAEGTFGRAKNKWAVLLRGGGGMRYCCFLIFLIT